MKARLLGFAAALSTLAAFAQAPEDQGFVPIAEDARDELSAQDRAGIWEQIDAARSKLALRPKAGTRPAFQWPLRAARGYSDPFFDTISNFFDHDADHPDHLKDYNCGARTYDTDSGNHKGTDISIGPNGWALMAARQVEIVAAAPGTIVGRVDGNFDRNCRFNSLSWNAVYVQHDDGSVAWYGHMKNGSVTAKGVGSRVATGEYLGNVGSSGNSTGPHLHFEVYDSAGRLVDPFAGQCNTRNVDSWWASQPPYFVTHVNRVIIASAQPVFSTCGADGQLQDPGSYNPKASFKPGDVVYVVALARDIQAAQEILFTAWRPDGTVWRQRSLTSSGQYPSSYAWISAGLEANAPTGTWLVEVTIGGTKAQASFDVTPSGAPRANYTDLWWNAAESGWGVNLIHQGDTLFATWFTYDTDRSGMWLVMADARQQPDGSFTGTISRTSGIPLAQINGQQAQTGAASVGTGTLRFASPQQGTFSYTVNGASQQKAITRYVFDASATTCAFTTATRAPATNYQDLWWNAAESGWGVNLAHQGDVLFATWFTYGAGGRAQWLAADLRRQPTGEFRGRLYRTTGTPLAQINGAPASSGGVDAGDMTITFADGEHARMDYTVDGIAQAKSITRYAFATPQTLCR